MSQTKHNSSIMSDLLVGILFNWPVAPVRGEVTDYIAEAAVEDQVQATEKALTKLDLKSQRLPLKDEVENLIRALKSYNPDVVINLCEGAFGDSHLEMCVPSLLDLLRIPYTGSPPLTLGLCQNKGLTKDLLTARGVPTPKYQVLKRVSELKDSMDYPLFVKPLKEDASLGITKESFVKNEIELKRRVEYITQRYRQPSLVEKYVEGRELNVALLGNTKPQVLPISEILFEFTNEPKIVDYSAKWLKESDEYGKTKPTCPAKLEPSLRTRVEKVALQAYMALSCRDYARVDIRVEGRIPYVLEVNPNPDISPESGFVRSLKVAAIPFEKFVEELIVFALERKPPQLTS